MRQSANLGRFTDSALRVAATNIACRFDLELVILFGSAVNDRARAEDLDIGVRARNLVDAVQLTNEFIQQLGTQGVDLVDLRRADPLLLMLAARDGLALYQSEPSRFDEFASLAARRYADTAKFRREESAAIDDFLAKRGLRP